MALTDYDVYQGLHPIEAIDQAITDIDTVKTLIPSGASAQNKLVTESDIETVETDIASKQDSLTTAQMAAVNSGATAEIIESIGDKQDALTEEQMAAANSGVTAANVAELENARTNVEGIEYPTLKDHLDATESRIDDIDEIYSTGFNLLNPDTVKRNYLLTSTGEEVSSTNAFVSDYIEVSSGQPYKINRAIGSQSYPTLVYYNSSKEFLSASDGTSTTFSIPTGCKFVRINGSLSYLSQSYFMPSYCTERFDFQKTIGGKNKVDYYLWSENHIFYYDGALHSKSYIYLSNQDKIDYLLGKNVPVSGSGAYLFWNKTTGALVASNTSTTLGKDVYFLCFLKYPTFESEIKFTALTCAYPAFTFDFITNKLYIDFKWYGYLFYNGQTYEIPRYYTQELDISEFSMIVFDVETETFKSILFDTVKYGKGKYIPVCIRNYGEIIGNVGYELKPYAKSYKTMLCYGDSLTWYDGHEFTWGPHEGEICVGYETYLRQYLRFAVSNVGVSGETTPQICARLSSDDAPATAHYITIMGGDNDDRLSITPGTVLPVGSTFDTTTVAGALQNAIETVLASNPDVRIILMTEPIGWTYRNGSMERVDDVYPQTYRNVATLYGLPLIDLWKNSGMNELNREEYMIDPTVDDGNRSYIYHPSNKAWERLGKMICEELKKY